MKAFVTFPSASSSLFESFVILQIVVGLDNTHTHTHTMRTIDVK
jgi:hypothetical protein